MVEILNDLEFLKRTRDDIKLQLEEMPVIQGVSYDKVGGRGSNTSDMVSLMAQRKLEIEAKLTMHNDIINSVERALNSLDDDERLIIEETCIKNKNHYKDAITALEHKLFTSRSSIYRTRNKALTKLRYQLFDIKS